MKSESLKPSKWDNGKRKPFCRVKTDSRHEVENQLELSLRQACESLEPKLQPPFSQEIPDQQEFLELNRAIVYGVLCDSGSSEVHVKHLHALVTDGYAFFSSLLVGIVVELYGKLVESAKIQLLWATKEMVAVSSVGLEDLPVSLLLRIGSGDYGDQNVWLCSELVSLFLDIGSELGIMGIIREYILNKR